MKQVARAGEGIRKPLVVVTGGEPGLQLTRPSGLLFLAMLRDAGMVTAVETNGTVNLECAEHLLDHITVSPKPLVGIEGMDHIVQRRGTDLKVVVPSPFNVEACLLLGRGFRHHFFQPMDRGDLGQEATPMAVGLASMLGWRVSIQVHKHAGWE